MDNAEITLECNPGPADRGDLAGFRAAGVNRLSIGAQSLNEVELQSLGRGHSPTDVAETVAEARRGRRRQRQHRPAVRRPGSDTGTLAGYRWRRLA